MSNLKSFLNGVEIFSGLSNNDIERFAEAGQEKTYKKDEVIFYAGDKGDSLFIIKSGLVKVSISSGSGDEQILRIFHPNDFFGEMSVLDGYPRSATVTAMEKSAAFIIRRMDVIRLIKQHPQVALNLLQILSIRLRKTDEQIASLRFADAYKKVAKALLDISNEDGKKEGNKVIINLNISRQELADLVGLTRETISRTLAGFQMCGYIKIDKRNIIILNKSLLKAEIESVFV